LKHQCCVLQQGGGWAQGHGPADMTLCVCVCVGECGCASVC